MKLLWLSHLVPYPPKGGVLQRSYHLLRETAKRHDVYLLAFVQRGLLARRFPTVDHGLQEAHTALSRICRDVRFVPIPSEQRAAGAHRLALGSLFSAQPYAIRWLRSMAFGQALEELLQRHRFDVVHFDTISLAPYLRFFPTTKTVLDHHNIESHLMLRRAGQGGNPLKRLYFFQEGMKLERYERKVCPLFSAHITCSELDSQRLINIAGRVAVHEIPNGVDVEYFSPTSDREEPFRLIFAGGMNWYPNRSAISFFARDVWPRLKQVVPNVSMDVVGFDPPPILHELAQRDTSFRVHGFVDDVRPYLARASVYVCPITDGGGTKLKLLDAFAMTKATVAHPVACEGIDVTPGVDVLLASTVDEYIGQIKLLLDNPAKRVEMGAAARRLILERYAYHAIGQKLSDLYEALAIQEHRCPSEAIL